MTQDEIRQLFVDAAVAVVGLSASEPTRDRYIDFLATSEADRANARERLALAGMSSCALVERALWFSLGVVHPILSSPYRETRAVSDVIGIARDARALRSADYRPKLGDGIVIEQPEHVLTVVGWRDDGTLCSVDGGQRDKRGLEAIDRRERVYDASTRRLGGRPILYVIDCIAIASLIPSVAAAA